jgi:hypothetical protein
MENLNRAHNNAQRFSLEIGHRFLPYFYSVLQIKVIAERAYSIRTRPVREPLIYGVFLIIYVSKTFYNARS